MWPETFPTNDNEDRIHDYNDRLFAARWQLLSMPPPKTASFTLNETVSFPVNDNISTSLSTTWLCAK